MRNQFTPMPLGVHPAPNPTNPTDTSSSPYGTYIAHTSGQCIYTPAGSIVALRKRYPKRSLTAVNGYGCDLLQFAQAGHASCTPIGTNDDLPNGPLTIRRFVTPDRQHSDDPGAFVDEVVFAVYDYNFRGKEFLLYAENSRDGMYMQMEMFYILGAESEDVVVGEGGDKGADELVEAASRWLLALHEEVLVFDQGWWQKDKGLYKSILAAKWDDVILSADKKKALQDDVGSFFASEKAYKEFAVPWKVSLIFKFLYSDKSYINCKI